jgi:hypothetical protein
LRSKRKAAVIALSAFGVIAIATLTCIPTVVALHGVHSAQQAA